MTCLSSILLLTYKVEHNSPIVKAGLAPLFFIERTRTISPMNPAVNQAVVLVTGAGRRLGRAIALHLARAGWRVTIHCHRSEEHTSELQSLYDLVCRLLLEKKKQ